MILILYMNTFAQMIMKIYFSTVSKKGQHIFNEPDTH